MVNTAKQCRLGLFQDSDFAGDLDDSKSTSGGTLCVFGSHTFVPISWMCKKTNFGFTQFSRIRNHLVGHWIEIGWFACSGTMGSNCFCSWKCFSCFKSIGETWEWWSQTPRVSQQNRCNERHWCCSFKCSIREPRSFIVCVWGQWSSDQDDYKRKKSHDETCFQDPQSCAWLVIRSNQFGPPESKSSTSTPKTNLPTC